ncbi:SAF domain-containing protein [Myceligenerans crystallogenes]|uniref:SAF domain-containing protein n=1 Tax=Myceligenerans crystallogenes TaxID=316335 RepID=A0ABN2NBT6_9MICO
MNLLGRPFQRGASGRPDAARLLRRTRRLVWRHRVLLAAICCGLAVTSALQVLRPPPPPSSTVLVTTRAVPVGTELTGDDVAERVIADALAPGSTLRRTAEAVGRTAVVGLPAGVPLHGGLLSDGGVLSSAPRGTVVVPVALADDGVAALLRPGDRVDLLTPAAAGSQVTGDDGGSPPAAYLARRALVLPLPEQRDPGDAAAGGLLGSGAGPPSVTLVAVRPGEAPDLSAIAGTGAVSAILVR